MNLKKVKYEIVIINRSLKEAVNKLFSFVSIK